MSTRPPKRRRRGGGDGGREMPMVPDVQFSSYYGRPVVKPAPWGNEIAAYLFLGGLAGGSVLLAAGGQLTGRPALRRNSRLAALAAITLSTAALISDLGRPRAFPQHDADRQADVADESRLVDSRRVRRRHRGRGRRRGRSDDRAAAPARPAACGGACGGRTGGLVGRGVRGSAVVYTAVLLADTATPTWNAAQRDLPFVFAGSASLASGGLAMVTTPVAEAGPARPLAVLGVIGDLIAIRVMEHRMDPIAAEPLHDGSAGAMLRWSERLAVAGGLGTVLGGRRRGVAVMSGLCLLAASALTRFGVFEAGIESAKDPRYTIEPQKRRLAARRAAGITGDSISTAR